MTTLSRLGLAARFNLLIGVLLLGVATLLAGFMVYRDLDRDYQGLLAHDRAIAALGADSAEYALYTRNSEEIAKQLRYIARVPEVERASFLDPEGREIAALETGISDLSSAMVHSEPPSLLHLLGRSGEHLVQIIEPVKGGAGNDSSALLLATGKRPVMIIPIGYLRLDIGLASFREEAKHSLYLTLIGVAGFVGLGVLGTALISRHVVTPLRQLRRAAHDVAEGRLDPVRIGQASPEVKELEADFNIMTERLRDYRDKEARHMESLERQVAERTEALRTAVRRAEESAQAAKAASEAKTQFLATISHELRTPLNVILGFGDLLLKTPLSVQQGRYANLVQSSSRHLLELINQILDVSKLEAGRVELQPEPFELRSLLDELANLFAEQAKRAGLYFRVMLVPDRPLWVKADRLRLRQVLFNLIGNAFKFTQRGGVTVRVSRMEETAGYVRCTFDVEDTGMGISSAEHRRIFERFTQADGSITRRFGGTGLGLAIVEQLVRLMGGEVSVESEVERGARFSFALDLALEPPSGQEEEFSCAVPDEPPPPPSPRVAGRVHPPRVLLAEDVAVNQALGREMLEGLGCQVSVAENGMATLMALDGERFDLLLLDCHMPIMDGFTVAQEIRKSEAGRRHLPIVALTADAMPGTRERCLQVGMDDYVAKPFGRRELAAILEQWVGWKRPSTPPAGDSPDGGDLR